MENARGDGWTPDQLDEVEFTFIDEVSSRRLYEGLAAADGNPGRAGKLRELARYEERHAEIWEEILKGQGRPVPARRMLLEHRAIVWLGRLLGVGAVLPLAHKNEVDGIARYRDQADRWKHPGAQRALGEVLPDEVVHEVDLFEQSRGLAAAGGVLRSTILGANDGLGSILALVAGVAGATDSRQTVIVAGLAGLAAGATSMAASNYTSVKAEQEVYASQLRLQTQGIEVSPGTKRTQLEEAYRRRGLSEAEAAAVVERVAGDTPRFAKALLAEEGAAPAGFQSPGVLAAYTGAAFLVTGIVPVLPFFFLPVREAVLCSVAVSGAALFMAGVVRALTTLSSFLRSGLEMTAVGLGSAGVTWILGRLVGVVLD